MANAASGGVGDAIEPGICFLFIYDHLKLMAISLVRFACTNSTVHEVSFLIYLFQEHMRLYNMPYFHFPLVIRRPESVTIKWNVSRMTNWPNCACCPPTESFHNRACKC